MNERHKQFKWNAFHNYVGVIRYLTCGICHSIMIKVVATSQKILNARLRPRTTTPNWEELPTLHFWIPFRYEFSSMERLCLKIWQNRYHELIRVGRQYRHLTELATFGFGHKCTAPTLGEMVFFCPTCPQPVVNLPDNWNDNPQDPDNWKYTRGFVANGNFTAAHQKQLRPEDDVWLKHGETQRVLWLKEDLTWTTFGTQLKIMMWVCLFMEKAS